MRRAAHDGQMRALQENATSRSKPQPAQRTRAKPFARIRNRGSSGSSSRRKLAGRGHSRSARARHRGTSRAARGRRRARASSPARGAGTRAANARRRGPLPRDPLRAPPLPPTRPQQEAVQRDFPRAEPAVRWAGVRFLDPSRPSRSQNGMSSSSGDGYAIWETPWACMDSLHSRAQRARALACLCLSTLVVPFLLFGHSGNCSLKLPRIS